MHETTVRWPRRAIAVSAFTIVLMATSIAMANTTSISPSNQSGNAPFGASWSLGWSGTPPYHVEWVRGDGSDRHWNGVSTTGASDSHTFYSCVSTVFNQILTLYTPPDTPLSVKTSKVTITTGNPPCPAP